MTRRFFAFALVFALSCGNAAVTNSSPYSYQTASVTFNTAASVPVTILAEIADSDELRSYGLMNRESLGENNGMLFVFDGESTRSFWMKDTLITLDMIFIGADKSILYIEKRTTPLSLASISPDVPAQYIVEVNGGFCERNLVAVGDSVEFQL